MVICLERDADLHMAQLIPLPLTVSCFSKIQTGFTFSVLAHPGSPGQSAVKRVCVLWARLTNNNSPAALALSDQKSEYPLSSGTLEFKDLSRTTTHILKNTRYAASLHVAKFTKHRHRRKAQSGPQPL